MRYVWALFVALLAACPQARAQQSFAMPCMNASGQLTYALPCNQSAGNEATATTYGAGPLGRDVMHAVKCLQCNTQYTSNHFGQGPPYYANQTLSQCQSANDCTWTEAYNQTVGGSSQATTIAFTPIAAGWDMLFGIPWMGDNATSAGVPDPNRTIVAGVNKLAISGTFTVDSNFKIQELDENLYYNGTQAVIASQCVFGGTFDVSNMPGTAWTPTTIPCPFTAGSTYTETLLGHLNKTGSAINSVTYDTVCFNNSCQPIGITVNACNSANSCSSAPPASDLGVNGQYQSNDQATGATSTFSISFGTGYWI